MPNALQVSPVEADAVALANELGDVYSSKQLQTIFNSVASEARTLEERRFVVMSARAMKVDILRGECHVLRFSKKVKDTSGATRYVDAIQVVKDYNVDMTAARAEGFLVSGAAVCERDVWEGWDAVTCRPLKHQIRPGDRGKVIGGWARGENPNTKQVIGSFFEWEELVRQYYDRQSSTWLPSGMWKTHPATMTEKAACQRVARRISPSSEGSMETDATPVAPTRTLPAFPNTSGTRLSAPDDLVARDAQDREEEARHEAETAQAAAELEQPAGNGEDEASITDSGTTPFDDPSKAAERPETKPAPAAAIVDAAKAILDRAGEICQWRGGPASIGDVLDEILVGTEAKGKGRKFLDHLAAMVHRGEVPANIRDAKWYIARATDMGGIWERERAANDKKSAGGANA